MSAALLMISCSQKIDWPFDQDDNLPLPSGTEGSTYDFSIIGYDGLLATDNDSDVQDKSDSDVYWEAEAEADGTFKNTITINGGKVNVMTYDDAINAKEIVTVTGGEIYCLSVHNDGIDSNGNILVKGGTITSIASNRAGVILSSSKFVKGGTYTISIGSTTYQTVTLSNKITSIGTQTGPWGGGGGFGPGGW